jgi:hypothetical protein
VRYEDLICLLSLLKHVRYEDLICLLPHKVSRNKTPQIMCDKLLFSITSQGIFLLKYVDFFFCRNLIEKSLKFD